jgi:Protein of unknown function (DUF3152)
LLVRGWIAVAALGLLAAGCDASEEFERWSTLPAASAEASGTVPPSPSPAASPSVSPGPDRGKGTFSQVAAGESSIIGEAGTLVTYCARVEDGINSFGPDEFASVVDAALADSRSWIAAKKWRFQRVPNCENVRLRVNLATPPTVDRNCAGAAQTVGRWSCFNNRAVHINLDRWKFGVVHAGGDLAAYRVMVINHEVGHSLGFSHVGCPGQGKTAPVMLPQSRGLDGCVFNPYPYPDGVNYIT